MYKLFISLRYLRARTISYIAIGVLALGVAILIIVTSVMSGFQREFHKKIRGSLADIAVESKQYFGIEDVETLQATIEKVPRVTATSPYIEHIVLVDSLMNKDYGRLKGVDPVQEVQTSELSRFIMSERELLEEEAAESSPMMRELLKSRFEKASTKKPEAKDLLARTPSGKPGIIVGVQLYIFMRLGIGDTLRLVTTSTLDKYRFEETDARKMDFEITGVYKTGMFETDKRDMYAALRPAQQFIGVPGRLSGISVKVDDYEAAEEIARGVKRAIADPSLYVLPWKLRNVTLMRAVDTERWMIGFIVFFMIVLAGLNLTAILILLVIEKTKDLGILAAIGAGRAGLMSIFLLQGLYVGLGGSIFGTLFGYLFVLNINWIDKNIVASLIGHPVFNPEVYYLDQIPAEISPSSIAVSVGATLVLGIVLAIYPAIRAARLEPMEALRYE